MNETFKEKMARLKAEEEAKKKQKKDEFDEKIKQSAQKAAANLKCNSDTIPIHVVTQSEFNVAIKALEANLLTLLKDMTDSKLRIEKLESNTITIPEFVQIAWNDVFPQLLKNAQKRGATGKETNLKIINQFINGK
jgi:hypothetical protein